MKSIKTALIFLTILVAPVLLRAAGELNLFGWSEYVPQEVIDGFTKETGIRVNFETYASNEELLSKLVAGGGAYDLIQPSEYTVELLIRRNMLAPLDRAKLPNLKNIGPDFLNLPYDPSGKYSIPYMTGTVGIVVNTEKVKEPIKGYLDVFQAKHADRLVVLNDNRELVTWALHTLGLTSSDVSAANLAKARPIVGAWVKLVKVFDSDSPKTALLNGDVDIGIVWSGEAAICWNENKKFHYVLPVEGAHMFVDSLCIPATAKNKAAAHQFMNYIMRPEVSKLISDKFPYTNPNLAARKLLSAEQLANPASYPASSKLETFRDIGAAAADIDKLVTDLKSAQ
ncbi:MAG: spermidine/putrescine ABC transporter substrate-binding protein [Opitutae bacterium]